MKHIYLSVLLVLSISIMNAQPAFTSADLPDIGDKDTVMYLNYIPITNDLDSETSNGYNWDFSALPFSTYPNFIYLDTWRVKTHQVSQPFPDATIEEFIEDGTAGDVNLYSYSNDTLYVHRLGSVVNGANFIPPYPSIAFPVSFNSASVITAYFHAGIYATGERTTTFLYDGYGTLQMPGNKSYSNVLRIKKIEKDSNYVVHSSITYISYFWYKQGGQVPLLRLAYTGSLNLYFAFGSKAAGSSNGMNDPSGAVDFTVAPNPSDGRFKISGLNFAPDKTEVYNMLGDKVATRQDNGMFDLTSSPKGIYFITVSGEKRKCTRKVVIR
jgi:hypothetical protein